MTDACDICLAFLAMIVASYWMGLVWLIDTLDEITRAIRDLKKGESH